MSSSARALNFNTGPPAIYEDYQKTLIVTVAHRKTFQPLKTKDDSINDSERAEVAKALTKR
jgi:hypothetical protein